MICKSFSPIPGKIRITFELPASLWAESVSVVADFNDWDPSATPLHQDRDGVWWAVVDLPFCQHYEFRYLIDGRWSTDRHADGFQPNGSGSCNSIVSTRPLRRRPNLNLG